MLQHSLYEILSKSNQDENIACYTIRINPESEIYKAHFPNFPITPGACLVEIARELLEDHIAEPVHLKKIINTKFLVPVIPRQVEEMAIYFKQKEWEEKTGNILPLEIRFCKEDIVFSKMSLLFEF